MLLNDEGSTATSDGRKYYTDGPRVHEYLQEMNRNVLQEKMSLQLEKCHLRQLIIVLNILILSVMN